MKRPLFISISLILSLSVSAQVTANSVKKTVELVYSKIHLDSLQQKSIQMSDTLRAAFHKIDSIRTNFNLAADSIQTQYHTTVKKIDAEANKLKENIDSLLRLNVPATRHMNSLDSLNHLRQTAEAKFTSRFNTLKAKTTDKLNGFNLPPEYQQPLGEVTKKINDLNLAGDAIKSPELKMPDSTLPKIDGIGDVTSRAAQIGKVDDLGELRAIETPVGDLGKVSQHVQGYQSDVKNITQGNVSDIQSLPETIEEQATKIKSLDELQK